MDKSKQIQTLKLYISNDGIEVDRLFKRINQLRNNIKKNTDMLYKCCDHDWVIDRDNCDHHRTRRICRICDLST